MTLKEIKKKMLKWKDIYGGDIPYEDMINNAKNKQDLSKVFSRFHNLLIDTANDAVRDMEEFQKSLGIDY